MKKPRTIIAVSILCLVVLFGAAAFLLWTPGLEIHDGRHDKGQNAIWLQHGWLGGDEWFARYHKDKTLFRNDEQLSKLYSQLKENHIKFVFPHLCPSLKDGSLAVCDDQQAEKFLDKLDGVSVLPWIGGVLGTDVFLNDPAWRSNFVDSSVALLKKHPRLSGIHLNIEPMPSGEKNYLVLLDELRKKLPRGKIISIAAYPPPTLLHPSSIVHWEEPFSRKVAQRVDQVAVMLYDTAIRTPKIYQELMKTWTRQSLDWYSPNQVLLGIPAYDDEGVEYHDPKTENIPNSLAGIHAGISDPMPKNYQGIAIYCEWEMDQQKWRELREEFLKR